MQPQRSFPLGHWRNVAHNSKREGKSIIWKLIYLLSNIFGMSEPATIKKKNLSLIIPFHAQLQATPAAQKEGGGQTQPYNWFLTWDPH